MGLKGDDIIVLFFQEIVKYGFDIVCCCVIGMISEDLLKFWKNSIEDYYCKMIDGCKEVFVGKEIVSKENGGCLNIVLEISFNGCYVIFLLEKDVFGIDFFLVEVRIGKIICKVVSNSWGGYIDDFNYIEFLGIWLFNSWEFVYVGVVKGDNIFIISEVEFGKMILEELILGVFVFSNLVWLLDGCMVVVMGLVNGQVDLYVYDIWIKKVQ